MVSLSWHNECCPLPVVNIRFVFDFDWWKAGGPHHPIRRITVTQADITGRNNRRDWRVVISVCVTHDILFVALAVHLVSLWGENMWVLGLVFPPNSPWLKKLLYENEYILTLFFHQVQSLENTQQKMKSRQCIFVIYWHKRVPRESSLGEQVECCSWVFKQGQCYYDWNPTSNVWDRNLWQRAIFSIKKQTLVPLIG